MPRTSNSKPPSRYGGQPYRDLVPSALGAIPSALGAIGARTQLLEELPRRARSHPSTLGIRQHSKARQQRLAEIYGVRSNAETIMIYELVARKITTQNDIY